MAVAVVERWTVVERLKCRDENKAADLERWLVAVSGGSTVLIVVVYMCTVCEEMLTLMRLRRMQR